MKGAHEKLYHLVLHLILVPWLSCELPSQLLTEKVDCHEAYKPENPFTVHGKQCVPGSIHNIRR